MSAPCSAPPVRGFPAEEYARRCRQLQKKMTAAQIDIALFTTAPEFYYYCGFSTPFWHSPTRPWFLLLPADGMPVAVIPSIGAAVMEKCRIGALYTWTSPHPTDEGVSLLTETIRRLSGNSPTLGIMRGKQSLVRMAPADFDRLRQALPAMQLSDISSLMQQQRMIKSAAEIEKITVACAAAGSAFNHWDSWLAEGMPLRDIFREFIISCLRAGADEVAYLSGGCGCGGYTDVISPPDDSAIRAGDILMLDTGCIFDGYHCDFDRNIACRRADDRARHCHETLWHATEAGLQAAVAGATCADLFTAIHDVICSRGYGSSDSGAAVGRYGHGLGIELTELPSVTNWDNTELAAGMVLTLEPSAMIDDTRMLVHEENIVIGEDGKAQLLTRRAAETLPVFSAP